MHSLSVPASITKRKQACKSCRQRKRRCGGERPSCSLCRKWGLHCEYPVPAWDHEDKNPMAPDYSGTLLGNLRTPVDSFASWDPTLPLQLPDFGLNAFQTPQNATLSGAGYPTPASNFDGFVASSGETFEPVLFPGACLPSNTVVLELVEIFFNQLHHALPCFHKETFLEEVRSGLTLSKSPILLYSMIAVAASFHHDGSIKARRAEWYEQAKILYDMAGRDPDPGLRTLQAVLCLVFHAYGCGDFSACWLYIGKAWRQAVALGMNRIDSQHAVVMPLGMKDGADNDNRGYYDRRDWGPRTAIEKEECRRVLWLLFFLDRNQSWPTGWPTAIDERQFKIDIPVADSIFQAMSPVTNPDDVQSVPFTRNVDKLLASASQAKEPLNMFHYLVIAYILLGRTTELIHSIHDDPGSPEYAEQCEELDQWVMRLRLSMPRAATSVLDASVDDRGQVVWLNATLNTLLLLLHYRAVPFADHETMEGLFKKAVMAARSTSQIIKDATRTSIDLLLNVHIASSLYMACCVLIIHHRLEDDASLKNDIDFLELVFERMNDVFSVIGLKFIIALKRDKERSNEELLSLRERGYRGLLADCSKWSYVRDEVAKLGMTMS